MNTRHHYLRLLRTFALAALTAAATAACSDDIDNGSEPLTPPDGNGGIPVTFTADINPGSDANPAAAPGTRTILHPTDNGGFTVTWKGKDNYQLEHDQIRMWAAKENTLTNNGQYKTYIPSNSAASSLLVPLNEQNKLTLTEGGLWTFTAVYGGMPTLSWKIYSDLESQNQSGPNNTEHIAANDFSVATAEKHIEGSGEMPANIDLKFKHMLSALQLHVTNGTGAKLTVQEIRLVTDGDKIASKRFLDVITGDWKTENETQKDYLKLDITNPAALAPNVAAQDFHMLLFPGYGGKSMTITVITDCGEYTLKKPAPVDGFIAGTNYTTDITIRNSNLQSNETWTAIISNAEQLKTFRDQVNSGNNYAGATVRLTTDITLSGTWTPIGTQAKPFSGTFEGDGHSISGLNVDASTNSAGLFGYVKDGKVHNLRVSGTVTTTEDNAGGITGSLIGGTVENCIFDGTVSGKGYVGGIAGSTGKSQSITGQIAGCHTKGNVTATVVAGGIAGANFDITITNCYSEAEVTATNMAAGGIAGQNNGSAITHCYATGAISTKERGGGIVGYSYRSTVTDCIALNPSIKRTSGTDVNFGRIVGNKDSGTVTNCGAFSGMTIKDANGSFTGGSTSVAGDNLSREQCLTQTPYTTRGFTTANGWAFNSGTTWTYLPWNKAFENFSGITTDYRISVPNHLNSTN